MEDNFWTIFLNLIWQVLDAVEFLQYYKSHASDAMVVIKIVLSFSVLILYYNCFCSEISYAFSEQTSELP